MKAKLVKFGFNVAALPFMAHIACGQQGGFKRLKWGRFKLEGA